MHRLGWLALTVFCVGVVGQAVLQGNFAPATVQNPAPWTGATSYTATNMTWALRAPNLQLQISFKAAQYSVACGDRLIVADSVRGVVNTLTCASAVDGLTIVFPQNYAVNLTFLVAPGSPLATGFVVTYKAILAKFASGAVSVNVSMNETGTIATPFPWGQPGPQYSTKSIPLWVQTPFNAGATASWLLQSPPGTVITWIFDGMQLGYYDALVMYDGATTAAPMLYVSSFQNENKAPINNFQNFLVSTGNYMYVTYRVTQNSDYGQARAGFSATYTVTTTTPPITQCAANNTLLSIPYTISHPFPIYPPSPSQTYRNNQYCVWNFPAPSPGAYTRFRLARADLGFVAAADTITIREGVNNVVVGAWTTSTFPDSKNFVAGPSAYTYFSSLATSVTFKSDISVTGAGFVITVDEYANPCGQTASTNTQYLVNPWFPRGVYPNNLVNCSFYFPNTNFMQTYSGNVGVGDSFYMAYGSTPSNVTRGPRGFLMGNPVKYFPDRYYVTYLSSNNGFTFTYNSDASLSAYIAPNSAYSYYDTQWQEYQAYFFRYNPARTQSPYFTNGVPQRVSRWLDIYMENDGYWAYPNNARRTFLIFSPGLLCSYMTLTDGKDYFEILDSQGSVVDTWNGYAAYERTAPGPWGARFVSNFEFQTDFFLFRVKLADGPTICTPYTSLRSPTGAFSYPAAFGFDAYNSSATRTCMWNITVDPSRLILMTVNYSVSPGAFVKVFDGPDLTYPSQVFTALSESNQDGDSVLVQLNVSHSNTMLVVFETHDNAQNYGGGLGFRVTYKDTLPVAPARSCPAMTQVIMPGHDDQIVDYPAVYVTVPDTTWGTAAYQPNLECVYMFTGTHRAVISFTKIDLKQGDYLRVYDNRFSTKPLAEFTATNVVPAPVYGYGNSLYVVFTSDSTGAGLGVQAVIKSDPNSDVNMPCFNLPYGNGYGYGYDSPILATEVGYLTVPCHSDFKYPGTDWNRFPAPLQNSDPYYYVIEAPFGKQINLVMDAFYGQNEEIAVTNEITQLTWDTEGDTDPARDIFLQGGIQSLTGKLVINVNLNYYAYQSSIRFHWETIDTPKYIIDPESSYSDSITHSEYINYDPRPLVGALNYDWDNVSAYDNAYTNYFIYMDDPSSNQRRLQVIYDQIDLNEGDELYIEDYDTEETYRYPAGVETPLVYSTPTSTRIYTNIRQDEYSVLGNATGVHFLFSAPSRCMACMGLSSYSAIIGGGSFSAPCPYDGVSTYPFFNPICDNAFDAGPGNLVEITIDKFLLAAGDSLTFYEFEPIPSRVIATYTLAQGAGQTIVSTQRRVLMRFYQAQTATPTTGFYLRWRIRSPGECRPNTVLQAHNATYLNAPVASSTSSSSYMYSAFSDLYENVQAVEVPGRRQYDDSSYTYAPCLRCAWRINAQANERVRLDFTALSLRQGDQVVVYDGADSSQVVLAVFDQTYYDVMPVVLAAGGSLYVTLKTGTTNSVFNGTMAFQYSSTSSTNICDGYTNYHTSVRWLIGSAFTVSFPCPYGVTLDDGDTNGARNFMWGLQSPMGTTQTTQFRAVDLSLNAPLVGNNSWSLINGRIVPAGTGVVYRTIATYTNQNLASTSNRGALVWNIGPAYDSEVSFTSANVLTGWQVYSVSSGTATMGPVAFDDSNACYAACDQTTTCPTVPSTTSTVSSCTTTGPEAGSFCRAASCQPGYNGELLEWACMKADACATPKYQMTISACKPLGCDPIVPTLGLTSTCLASRTLVGRVCNVTCPLSTVGTVASFQCNATGANTAAYYPDVTFGNGGCTPVYCPSIPSVSGVYSSSCSGGAQAGDTCRLKCRSGLMGTPTLVPCLQPTVGVDQPFYPSYTAPTCVPLYCPPFPDGPSYVSSCAHNNTAYGHYCIINCRPGYTGDYAFLFCDGTSDNSRGVLYNSQNIQCRPTYCPAISTTAAVVSGCTDPTADYAVGATCTLQCAPGYVSTSLALPPIITTTCNQSALDEIYFYYQSSTSYFNRDEVAYWDLTIEPSCIQTTCPSLPGGDNYTTSCVTDFLNYGQQCTIYCNAGLMGPIYYATCTQTTIGGPLFYNNTAAPTCVAAECTNTNITGYDLTCASTPVPIGGTCTASCATGYQGPSSGVTVTCRQAQPGAVAGFTNLPSCTPAYCPAFATDPSYVASQDRAIGGDVVTFTCAPGYAGTAISHTCVQSAVGGSVSWDSLQAPSCLPTSCAAIASSSSFDSSCPDGTVALGSTCTLTCKTGEVTVFTCVQKTAGAPATFATDTSVPSCVDPALAAIAGAISSGAAATAAAIVLGLLLLILIILLLVFCILKRKGKVRAAWLDGESNKQPTQPPSRPTSQVAMNPVATQPSTPDIEPAKSP